MSLVGSQVEGAPEGKRRRRGVLLSFSFFFGVVLSLLALGVAASFAGRLFSRWNAAFAFGVAAFSFIAGLAAIFGPSVRRHVPDPEVNKRGGMAGAFLYGLLYSVATVTTSAGPLLLLLTVAAAIGRPAYGAALSLSYAIGRGLPFLLLGLFAGTVGSWLARLGRARRIAEVVSGIALLVLSVYFVRLAQTL
ncbi:MAG: thiol:disulfide interchange protein [Pyrinomonadaceae bacterium]|nr:thiol:disulfide interchange protein [Pyrinomonadaceae bacterium]